MTEQQHKNFILQEKELFKKSFVKGTIYDLSEHPSSETHPYDFADKNTNERWLGWLDHATENLNLKSDCMIGHTWFMKGSPVSALIKHAEEIYKAEVIAQNSKIKFGTDDNEVWWAHDVPYFGEVQMNWIKEDQEWDIYLDGCWQGPFNSKSECIQHLEECIQEKREEDQEHTA
ncbi:hypothetical protein F938_03626 [Acinetobacter bereziniae LMG 1003 = CIP 70.12]|uniref:Uncharacterized protein n=1 Tax=Acinetobacter bereziniae LMG 1003 = CIP 70.12 TaxID=981324 RepID=N9CZ44_ACIBZ|nr:hypothetical protein [Acinetobacter bereziniae]ENV91127.1 hypothetical protein F938_03626 [Acinetobacter bereziniae LMG 1003 = CIP 70.12]